MLLHAALLGDETLCDVFDGLLLPPPHSGLVVVSSQQDLGMYALEHRPIVLVAHRAALVQAVNKVPSDWREVVALFPLNIALRSGVYDSRLRSAMRRLCSILAVDWSVVERREEVLSTIDLEDLTREEAEEGQQRTVIGRKVNKKYSAKRIAAVGAFAAVGGVALFLTGGLAAPVIAPAFGALLGAATATLSFVGALGTALLGGGAIAAAFAALIGAATHAAAMAALLTPLLTAANLTAIFGVGGASLAGYKGLRRTGESDAPLLIRGVDEIEELPQLHIVVEDVEAPNRPTTALDDSGGTPANTSETAGNTSDYLDEIFSKSLSGLVVPDYTVNVCLRNLAAHSRLQSRNRVNLVAIECKLDGVGLVLKALKLDAGVWAHVPPREVPPHHAAVSASHNKVARPTGAGGIMCYQLVAFTDTHQQRSRFDVDTSNSKYYAKEIQHLCEDGGLKLWILSQTSLVGTTYLSVIVERPSCKLAPSVIIRRLQKEMVSVPDVYSVDGIMVVELRFEPFPRVVVKYSDKLGRPGLEALGAFHKRELAQRLEDTLDKVKKRRVVTAVISNTSDHTIVIRSVRCVTGNPALNLAAPSVLCKNQCGFMTFANGEYSLQGAEAHFLVEVTHSSSGAVTTGKLVVEVNALDQCHGACYFHPGPSRLFPLPSELKFPNIEGTDNKPRAVESLVDPETDAPLSFISATICVLEKQNRVTLTIANAADRLKLHVKPHQRMTLTIGVSGFIDTIDPRRLPADQQVALWQPILKQHRLFSNSEALAAVWEDAYQRRLSSTVGFVKSESIVNEATSKIISKGKSQVKQHLMAGALFAGLRALDALKGTFELPLYAIWATDLIDNTYATLEHRADYTGKDLAAALLSSLRGHRPVTLVGFSFGSSVIAHCLEELHNVKGFGIVENVYLLGSTFAADRRLWQKFREVASGRVVNIYNRRDWLLWAMYKANSSTLKPLSGLTRVDGVEGVENIDASAIVDSHASFATKLDALLDLIPPCPTTETLSQAAESGSPGAVLPAGECSDTVDRLYSSMSLPLFDTDVAVLGAINRITSGVFGLDESLYFVGAKLYCAQFDFAPPQKIGTAQCGLLGVIRQVRAATVTSAQQEGGEEGENAVAGVLGYAVSLQPLSPNVVLVLQYFMCIPSTSKGCRSNAVALLVPLYAGESESQLSVRLRSLVETHGSSHDEVVRISRGGPDSESASASTFDILGPRTVAEQDSNEEEVLGQLKLSMTMARGSAVWSLEGYLSPTELSATITSQAVSGVKLAEDTNPSRWQEASSGIVASIANVSLEVEEFLAEGLRGGHALELLATARSEFSRDVVTGSPLSPACLDCIFQPLVIVNTTGVVLMYSEATSVDTMESSHLSSWVRVPPSAIGIDQAAVMLLRCPISEALLAETDIDTNEKHDVLQFFSYTSDQMEYHFMVKRSAIQWPQPAVTQSGDSLLSSSPTSGHCQKVSVSLSMQCFAERLQYVNEATTLCVTVDAKEINGVRVLFAFLRPHASSSVVQKDEVRDDEADDNASAPQIQGATASSWIFF